MKKRIIMILSAVFFAGVIIIPQAQSVGVDASIKGYAKTSGISGNLSSVGSDSLINVMTFLSEGFQKQYPGIKFQIEGKGSSTAPPALIAGTAQFGPMSRTMKSAEVDAFVKKYGYKPTEIVIAIDTLAVFVNKDNPVKFLSLDQVDAIFSKTRKGGYKSDIVTWGDLSLAGDWKNRPLSLYGRNSASGTYGFFKDHALAKGDFKDTVKEQPGSAAVVQGIEKDRFAIGYSGIGYLTSGVRAVPLALKSGNAPFAATYANALTGKYPLARNLYIYINKDPKKGVDPSVREFIKYVLSKNGQELIVKDGYYPLPAKVINDQLVKLK